MKKIVINKMEEHMEKYLQIDMDVILIVEGSEELQCHYEYEIKKESLDFYYIGNSWLPSSFDLADHYVLQIPKEETIITSDQFYTNMVDGMKLSDAVILYGEDLSTHLLAKIEQGELEMGEQESKRQEYLKKLSAFYERVFRKEVNCSIYVLDTDFEAVSFPNIVILNQAYLIRPNTYCYKFLPHELFHQVNGCFMRYHGIAKEWMRESFVEYLQLLYLREAINEKFYWSQLEGYRAMEKNWCACGVSVYQFTMKDHIEYYNDVIYGRGVMIFHEVFKGNIESIVEFVNRLYLCTRDMNVKEYLSVLETVVGIGPDYIMEKLRKSSIEVA